MSILSSTSSGMYSQLTTEYLYSKKWFRPKVRIGSELLELKRFQRDDGSNHKHFLEMFIDQQFSMALKVGKQTYRFEIKTLHDLALLEAVWDAKGHENSKAAKQMLLDNVEHTPSTPSNMRLWL